MIATNIHFSSKILIALNVKFSLSNIPGEHYNDVCVISMLPSMTTCWHLIKPITMKTAPSTWRRSVSYCWPIMTLRWSALRRDSTKKPSSCWTKPSRERRERRDCTSIGEVRNESCHLVAITGTIILVHSYPCQVTAPHLKMGYQSVDIYRYAIFK